MYGIIFSEMKKYVEIQLEGVSWKDLVEEAGLDSGVFLATKEYPDKYAVNLVSEICKSTGRTAQVILEEFGEFIAPDLIGMFGSLIKPEWRSLDLIENTEETIHKIVRLKNPGAKPPELKCSRPSPEEVIIKYGSSRKLCAVAKGIARGVAKHYNEHIAITEKSCMLEGGPICEISVRRLN